MLHRNVVSSLGQLQEEQQRLATRISSCVAGTLISLRCLPEKLNPVIRPLMDCIKTEADSVMQVLYMYVCVHVPARMESPVWKILPHIWPHICCMHEGCGLHAYMCLCHVTVPFGHVTKVTPDGPQKSLGLNSLHGMVCKTWPSNLCILLQPCFT